MHTYAWWGDWWMWLIWILGIIWVFGLWLPAARAKVLHGVVRGTPIEELQHRLARGEVTPEDYEARLAILRRDQKLR